MGTRSDHMGKRVHASESYNKKICDLADFGKLILIVTREVVSLHCDSVATECVKNVCSPSKV